MAATKAPAEQLITENIDVWTSAIKKRGSQGRGSNKKITLYGIKKLRELILELAVRGLLVPQDSNDEPASVLLEKIAAEKEQMIADGKIKKPKVLPEISKEEHPFELPSGWAFARLGDLTLRLGSGSTPRGGRSAYVESGVPFLRSQNVWNDGLHLDDIAYINEETHRKMDNTKVLPNDVLLNITGASLGRSTIFPKELIEANVSQHVTIIRLIQASLSSFVHLGIQSPIVQRLVWDRQVGMAIEGLSKKVLELFEFPMPPEAEQPRILAKVNELMALCDQLEQQTETSLTAHQTLVEALLNTLLTAAQTSTHSSDGLAKSDKVDKPDKANPKATVAKESGLTAKNTQSTRVARGAGFAGNEDALVSNSGENATSSSFDSAWNRIAQHFDVLFTTEHSIDQLKQTILQLAVMGKLVPQDPNDEPASVLLEKISKEKEQLIKDKKIKKGRSIDNLILDNCNWVYPESWSEIELQDMFKFIDYRGKNPMKSESGKRIITAKNIRNGFVKNDPVEYISEELYKTWMVRGFPKIGDILFVTEGHTMGFVAPVNMGYEFALAQRTICFQPYMDMHTDFFFYALMSGQFQKIITDNQTGSAAGGIKASKLKRVPIPVPPKNELKRISSKVVELMALCDTLKTHISESQSTQLHLADAMAEQALS